MEIRDLNVLHWRGQHIAGTLAPRAQAGDVFLIDTCQRRVGICASRSARLAAQVEFPTDGALEVFEAQDAYAFLLRFACGLESKLVAETEIFGQIKQAWRDFSERRSPLSLLLSPWVQLLFQDAKEVRSQYLAALGSASYGSQVRRLLGDEAAAGPTLLLGAGQLAQAIAPWLAGTELWLWNRSTARAAELARELAKRRPERPVRVLADQAAELGAWRAARNVVVCVPVDAARDAQRIGAWCERTVPSGRIVHLGLAEPAGSAWARLPQLVSLGALFDMLHAQTEQRRLQIERARRVCAEKALLRSLGASGTAPHSWEDLAAFDAL